MLREPKYKTGMEVIKRACLDCSSFQGTEVENCTVIDCVKWPVRFGLKPKTAEKRGHMVNPFEAAGKEYGEGPLKGRYKELPEDKPLWWELSIREIIKRFRAR